MGIPESQLDTWSHQGSVKQSSTTYNTIKNVLEDSDAPYANEDYSVFLQGSYGNYTNIYAESDVDIVIKLNSYFYYDIESLSDEEKAVFGKKFSSSAGYNYFDFKKDVLEHLIEEYGNSVEPGDKAIQIEANGNRRKADVIVATEYRNYYSFTSAHNAKFHRGICFYTAEGVQTANYPQQHSENCTTKHQTTEKWFKPMVRILKNMRGKLIEEKMLKDGTAPSYYIEGLLYNVPDDKFGESYGDSFVNSLNWLLEADRDDFVCANERYYLLREGSPVTWRASKCTKFLTALRDLWNEW